MPESRSRVEIKGAGKTGHLLIDGQDISRSVLGFRLDMDAHNGTELSIRLLAIPFSADLGECKVSVDLETRELLKLLGWTPPEEAT